MAFGIDTFRSRLDEFPYWPATAPVPPIASGGDFFVWNGNAAPLFAGRNFLFGDFIWGQAEATNASSEPDPKTAAPGVVVDPVDPASANPTHPENLTLLVRWIAPIQAPQAARQRLSDYRANLYGRIDADAICKRVAATMTSGEFAFSGQFIDIWLAVSPDADFNGSYWSGWASTVNSFTVSIYAQGMTTLLAELQPFRACILCTYTAGAGGRLRPDQSVITGLATPSGGIDASVHGFWADFSLWASAPADLVANGSPLLDWSRFDPAFAPALWRFASGFDTGTGPAAALMSIDALSPGSNRLNSMLEPQAWQPDVPATQVNGFQVGFSALAPLYRPAGAPVTGAVDRTPNILSVPIPDMMDNGGGTPTHVTPGHFRVPGGNATVIGRYIGKPAGNILTFEEADYLSANGFRLFTTWEKQRHFDQQIGGQQVGEADSSKHDPPAATWGTFTAQTKKFTYYFFLNQAGDSVAGPLDGAEAFAYCGDTLGQPSHTPIFFAIDCDPYDPTPAPPPSWPTQPTPAEAIAHIKKYFESLKVARDDYYSRTNRYFLIGAYGAGKTLRDLYFHGVVSHFWQALSFGHNGSTPPLWPWYHANRWQFLGDEQMDAQWSKAHAPVVTGADADADWGDGGTWSLRDGLVMWENLRVTFESVPAPAKKVDWGDLVTPPPVEVPPPPPPPP